MNNTIFVQIASYKDPELIPTITDLTKNASNPEALHIAIAWQHDEHETVDDFMDAGMDILGFSEDFSHIEDHHKIDALINAEFNGAKVTILDINYHKTNGACWARHKIQEVYNDEDYTLQLDSHHRFVDEWDKLCVDMLQELKDDGVPKPLLTAYIPSFDPENDPASRIQAPWKMDFDRFIPEGAVFFRPSTIDDWKQRDKPMRSRFYSAHFCFTDGNFVKEVPHDPQYFFHGEEISIAVRAFTHGYDLFHPNKVIAWHEYTRKGRTKVWDDMTTPEKKKGNVDLDWVERNNLCHKRNRILFGMDGEDPNQIDFGKYGFGTERTLREYEEYAGISFEYRGVQQYVIDKGEPPSDVKYETEEEWKNSFCRSNDVRILFSRSELGEEVLDDYDFFYIGAHDDNYDEIYREDLVGAEIYRHLKNEWIDFRLIFLADRIPKTFTVWPHSKSKGWLDRIVKDVETF